MNLVYSIAIGQDYFFHLAQEMIDSLRSQGYEEDVIILTDRHWEFEGATCAVFKETEDRCLWKAVLPKVVDCSKYEKILFVDSDIIFIKHPALVFALEGVRAPLEPVKMIMSGLNRCFLTPEEKETHKEAFGINAGTFLFPGSAAEVFLSAFEAGWKKYDWSQLPDYWPENQKYKGQMSDQSALQALVLRGELEVRPLPKNMVVFPGVEHVRDLSSAFMIHFCGPQQTTANKAKILEWMKAARENPQTVMDAIAAESYKWNGGRSDMQMLMDAVSKLRLAVNFQIQHINSLESRIAALEKQEASVHVE